MNTHLKLLDDLEKEMICKRAGSVMLLPHIPFSMINDLDIVVYKKDFKRLCSYLGEIGYSNACMLEGDEYPEEENRIKNEAKPSLKSISHTDVSSFYIVVHLFKLFLPIHILVVDLRDDVKQWSVEELLEFKTKRGKSTDLKQVKLYKKNTKLFNTLLSKFKKGVT